MDQVELAITLIGTTLVLVALFIELEHRVIWENYKKHYHPHRNRFADAVFRPNRWVYIANVYILWPFVLVMGLYMLFRQA
jgi:hypothetical protein